MAANQEILDTAPLWWEIQNIPTEVVDCPGHPNGN